MGEPEEYASGLGDEPEYKSATFPMYAFIAAFCVLVISCIVRLAAVQRSGCTEQNESLAKPATAPAKDKNGELDHFDLVPKTSERSDSPGGLQGLAMLPCDVPRLDKSQSQSQSSNGPPIGCESPFGKDSSEPPFETGSSTCTSFATTSFLSASRSDTKSSATKSSVCLPGDMSVLSRYL